MNLLDWLREPWIGLEMDGPWIVLMSFFVCLSCGWVGCFLVLRRMSLVGDAISHSVLPGLVIGFLFVKTLDSVWLLVGAALAGLLSTLIIEWIHKLSRVKQDAAIGISFTTLFALGVLLISLYTRNADLDQSCVLLGRLEFLPLSSKVGLGGLSVPRPLLTVIGVTVLELLAILAFYKVLLVCSFDSCLGITLRFGPARVHYALMMLTSVVVVASFEAVGAILVIALLILPGATAFLLVKRLPAMLFCVVPISAFSALGGWYLAFASGCSLGPAVVIAAALAFVIAWIFGPSGGVLPRYLARLRHRQHSTGTVEQSKVK